MCDDMGGCFVHLGGICCGHRDGYYGHWGMNLAVILSSNLGFDEWADENRKV